MATPVASEDQIHGETFAASLPDKFLDCRELGHNWRRWTCEWNKETKSYDRALRCVVCKSVRNLVCDDSGDVVKSSYDYKPGYLAVNVIKGTTSRSVFRLEGITRDMTRAGHAQESHLRQVS